MRKKPSIDIQNWAIDEKDIAKLIKLWKSTDVEWLKKLVSDLVNKKLASNKKEVQQEQKEESSFEMYKDLFLWANVWIWFSDLSSNKIEEVNKCFCDLLEVSMNDIVGKDISEFFSKHILDKEAYSKWKEIFKEKWELSSFELLFKTASWWEKWLLVSSRWIKSLKKEFFTVQDITDFKELQKSRETQINALQTLDEERKYMVDVMTHDLAWPILQAWWFCNRIYRKVEMDDIHKDFLKRAIDDLKKMERLVLNHLDIAKMERWEYKIRPESINIQILLEEKFDKFNHIYKDKSVQIWYNYSYINDDADIIWDKYWLDHLFDNLIKNAIEENIKNNSPKVDVFVVEEEKYVMIWINNAWFMTEELKKNIFKQRYVWSTKDSWNWIWSYFASTIAKVHKWEVFVWWSDKETGTTICIRLPKNPL